VLNVTKGQLVFANYGPYYREMKVIRTAMKTIFCRSLTGGEHKFWRETGREVGTGGRLLLALPPNVARHELDRDLEWPA
jgi:hypothetical protein